MTAEAGEGDRARFEKALRLYAQIGLAPERTIRQLLRAGFAPEWVRAAFPEQPERAFEVPTAPIAPSDGAAQLTPTIAPAPSRAHLSTGHLPPRLKRAETLASRVLERIATTRAEPSSVTPSASDASREPLPAILSEGVSFQYVPLIQCSFPHADPGAQTQFTRRNGWLELTLSTARPDTGLPYGVPARLLTIYCASEAIRTRSPEIFLGASVHDFLRRLDIPITRGDRGSLRVYANQLLRLIHCAISIDENIRDARGRTGLHIRQALFVDEARLWWDEASGVGQGSSLVLSPVLFDSILERSAPLSTQ
ncbi:MAG: replication protein RepA, partial [Steroidobacteraceae bacterium]